MGYPSPAGARLTPLSEDGDLQVERVEDKTEHWTGIVNTSKPISVRLTAAAFKIEAGKDYQVSTSQFPPWRVSSSKDGELDLAIPGIAENCTLIIANAPEQANLINNGSFEGEEGLKGWSVVEEGQIRSRLAYGHETLPGSPEQGQEKKAPTLGTLLSADPKDGEQILRLKKEDGPQNLLLRTKSSIKLTPGKDYIVSFWYRLPEAPFGASMHWTAALSSSGKPTLDFRDYLLNPPIATGDKNWSRSFFRVTVPNDYANPRLRLLFSMIGPAFEVDIDGVEITEAPAKVVQYPKILSDESMAPVHTEEELRKLLAARPPIAPKVISRDGGVTIEINGKPVPMFGFTAGPSVWPAHAGDHKAFSKAGVKLHWIPLYSNQNGSGFGEPVWFGPGKYDFGYVERQLLTILRQDPNAAVLFYLGLFPYPEMGDLHPDAVWRNPEGKMTGGTKDAFRAMDKRPADGREADNNWNYSYTSDVFRSEVGDFLKAFGKFLSENELGKAVAGIHMVCGSDGQWFAPHVPDHHDRSPDNLRAFRQWLRVRYNGDVEAFKKAWGDNNLTFETATLPEEAERSPEKFFLDPRIGADCRLIDSNRFSSEGVADTINLLADAFKQGMGRPTLVSTYYHDILHNHGGNHWALEKLLKAPSLDGIVSVTDYGLWRTPGRAGDYNSLAASIRLHGKFYLSELDYRTNLAWLPVDAMEYRNAFGVSANADAWKNQLRRDLGMVLCQGEGAWLYGLSGNAWYSDAYMEGVAEGAKAAKAAAEHPMPEDRGQIAIFADEEIEDVTTRKGIFNASMAMVGHNLTRVPLSRSGLTWDAFLLSDLTNPKRPEAKINIILSSASLKKDQIQWIKNNLQKNGNVVIFLNAIAPHLNMAEVSKEVVGIEVEMDEAKAGVRRMTSAPSGDPLAVGWEYLYSEMLTPYCVVTDPTATPLAHYVGTSDVASAVRRFDDWTGVYIGSPGAVTPKFLRALAKELNIQPVGPEGDVTYAGNGIMVLHAYSAGTKKLQWKGKSDVVDLSTGKRVASNTESLEVTVGLHETVWYQRQSPK